MAKFRLIEVNRTSTLLDTNSDSISYTLTYEKKVWFYFGKTKIVKSTVNCPDYKMSLWLKSVEEKIIRAEWRKG